MGAWRVALPYLILGIAWILFTDWAIVTFMADGPVVSQTTKGLVFVTLSAGLIYVLSARQLREKQITQRERERLERRISAAARFEAMGQLSGGIAHDFNNLLTVISGNIEAYVSRNPGVASASSELMDVRDAVRRATILTRRLLASGRSAGTPPHPTDVNEVVRGMASLLDRLIGDRIRVRAQLGYDVPAAQADPGRLEQVVMNLAINARDAMPDGGDLRLTTDTIRIGERNGDAGPARLLPGLYVRIEVADTGVGMSPDVQARIFEPFYTTKSQEKGTGLGLATVQSIVSEWGGEIAVQSAPGQGTIFTILLPVAIESVPRSAPDNAPGLETGRAESRAREPSRGRPAPESVLVVDDDYAVRVLVARVLRQHGFQVREAAGGREALAELRRADCCVDLVVTDASMPEMTGLRFIDEARSFDPALRVLLMSGHPDHEFRNVAPYLAKPFTAGDLVRHVREALDQ